MLVYEEVCRNRLGDYDFLCGDDAVIDPPKPRKGSFEAVWNLIESVSDGEVNIDDFVKVADQIFPDATENEIKFQFELHDLDDDGEVTRQEAKKVQLNTPHLHDAIELGKHAWN